MDGNSSAYGSADVEYINIPSTRTPKKRTYKRKTPGAPRKKMVRRSSYYGARRSYTQSAAMPLSKKLMFTYNDVTSINLAIPPGSPFAQQYFQYKINSLWDLNAQIGSTSTIGFTQWSAFYSKYHVKWARLTTTFVNTGANPVHVGVFIRPIHSEPVSLLGLWSYFREASDGNNLPIKSVLLTPTGGSKDRVTLSVSCPLGRLLGNPSEFAGDVGYSAATNTDPTLLQDAFVFMLDADGAVNIATGSYVTCKTTIKVIANMYQRRTLLA